MLSYTIISALLTLVVIFIFVKFQRKREQKRTEMEFELNPDGVFTIVAENAQPEGGLVAFYKFIRETMVYPDYAKQQKVEGIVYVQLVVEKDGSLSNMSVVRGLGFGCDEVAMSAVASYGNWIPAQIKGQLARQRMVLPIVFKLHKKS